MNNIEFSWKNLCITILPGMTVIGMTCLLTKIGGCGHCTPIGVSFFQLFSSSSWFDATMFFFLAVYVGYLVNNVASLAERALKLKDKSQEDREKRHEQMASIKHSSMIEEYFLHYAMARNMAFVHLLCIPLLFLCTYLCGCNVIAG